jgi:hypothetical protein
MLAAADEDLSVKWENVLMLGEQEAIKAAYEWRLVAWHIEWFARGLRDDPAEYEQANTVSGEKRQRFYSAVRDDLGVVGAPCLSSLGRLTGYSPWIGHPTPRERSRADRTQLVIRLQARGRAWPTMRATGAHGVRATSPALMLRRQQPNQRPSAFQV